MLGRREKDLLRLAAERVARSMSADSEMMVLRSEQCHKRTESTSRAFTISRSHPCLTEHTDDPTPLTALSLGTTSG